MRGLARALILVLVVASGFATWRAGLAVLRDPLLRPLVAATADQITAATDRYLAAEATPARVATLVAARLAEQPRNWIAIDALTDLAQERGLTLPPVLFADLDAAQALDDGLLTRIGGCAACAWDIGQCGLSQAMLCKAPILLTPVEDLRGIVKAGFDYGTGSPVDQLDLGLSVLGLSATALVVVSGGASGAVKGGTALVRLARGLNLLSPKLTGLLSGAFRTGIDWAALPLVRGADDVARLVRTDAIAPVLSIAGDFGRIADTLGPARALHLLPMVENAADASALGRVTTALGPRVIGRAEVLGKARLLRASVRVGSVATELVAGLIGLFAGLGMAVAGMIQSALLRGLRRLI